MIKKLKVISMIGLVAGASYIYDANTLTQTEMQTIRNESHFTAKETFIFDSVVNNREIKVDLSKMNTKEFLQTYINVLHKMGAKLNQNGRERDLSKIIIKRSKKMTTFIKI